MTVTTGQKRPRVLLLVPARSYRAADFLLAAARMNLDVTVASDGALPIGDRPVIVLNPSDPDRAARHVLAQASRAFDAVVAADSPMLVLASALAARMGLPHNPAGAVRDAGDKARQRERWRAAGVPQPDFRVVAADQPGSGRDSADGEEAAVRRAAGIVGFPCVVKAVSLSASQGVLRADDADAAAAAATRIRRVLAATRRPPGEPLLVEQYLTGPELSIDGLLAGGRLTPLALFDKPAMPDGPTFEETMLVTPSRLSASARAAAVRTAERAARALGLVTGPVHAELRIGPRGPAMLELAARSIGGLCSRVLRFPGGRGLEELIFAAALGEEPPDVTDDPGPARGVFMLPVPRAGTLRAVEGTDDARAVPGVTGVTISIPVGRTVVPLPEGDQYLGFIFAEASTRAGVARALATASARIRAIIG
ncbi:MAG TPA: ATP-grasp domain-containing protein [Streptosporangiaceae bacterium]|nr:ATP-grasp domain-containing protein [Streptosporangiaceae bacterium]